MPHNRRASTLYRRVLDGVLIFALVTQCFAGASMRAPSASASWKNLASTLDDAVALSTAIVVARVTDTSPGPDIAVPAPDEPGGVDRVGVDIVGLTVERVLSGNAPASFALFHTATTRLYQISSGYLDGDPPYVVGDRYVMFVRPGPNVGGMQLARSIAPEGRYTLSSDDTLHALTQRGVSPQLDGVRLVDLIDRLKKVKKNGHRGHGLLPALAGAAAIGIGIKLLQPRPTPQPAPTQPR